MNSLPIELNVGVLLLTIAPDCTLNAVRARFPAFIGQNPILVRVVGSSFLCLVDMSVFGFPQSFFGSALVAMSFAFLGICTGVLYYLVEDWRLGIARPGSIRVIKRAFPMNAESSLALGLLLWAALTEELLSRWYALTVPPAYGFLPLSACVFISSAAFGLSHQHFGSDVIVSRGVFGAVLTLPVLLWGNLLVPIVAHMVYNALVHLRPVQYVQVKKGI